MFFFLTVLGTRGQVKRRTKRCRGCSRMSTRVLGINKRNDGDLNRNSVIIRKGMNIKAELRNSYCFILHANEPSPRSVCKATLVPFVIKLHLSFASLFIDLRAGETAFLKRPPATVAKLLQLCLIAKETVIEARIRFGYSCN